MGILFVNDCVAPSESTPWADASGLAYNIYAWSDIRVAPSATGFDPDVDYGEIGVKKYGGSFTLSRFFIPFDLRSYAGSWINATIKLNFKHYTYPQNFTSPKLCFVLLQRVAQSDPFTYQNDAFPLPLDGFENMYLASDSIVDTSGLVDGDEIQFTLNAAGLSYMNSSMGKIAEFAVVEYDHDFLNVSP